MVGHGPIGLGPSRSEGGKEGEGESAQSSERERRKWLHLAPQLDAALYRWPPSVVRVNACGPPICKGRMSTQEFKTHKQAMPVPLLFMKIF